MKKLIIIICILLVIFIGMYIQTRQKLGQNVTAEEVSRIEEYISKIYMWKEVTEKALPKFSSINEAPEKWIWEVVKKNLNDYDEIAFEQIQEKSKELFGTEFTTEFPKEGNDNFIYDKEQDIYRGTNIELDTNMDTFLLNTITKNKDEYEVEIIEYIEDYSEESDNAETENNEFVIHIKNLEGQEILNVKSTEEKESKIAKIKENLDKFDKTTINLKEEDGNLVVRMVK